jgi:hypothetical protein
VHDGGRSNTVFTALKILVLARISIANVGTTKAVKAGLLASARRP